MLNITNPSGDLARLISGFQVTQAIHAVAALGIADQLAVGPRDSDSLAAATGADPRSLYRLLRALSALGVFKEEEGRVFSHTPMSEYLRTDKPGSLAGLANLFGRESYWRAWGAFLHSIRTGDVAFEHAHGEAVWAYRAARADEGRVFDSAMTTYTERVTAAALAAGRFERFKRIYDIGGGQGAFLAEVLASSGDAKGVLFDQPHVVAGAGQTLTRRGVADRCEVVGGDFFTHVPNGGDAYLLKLVLHDWDDSAALKILTSCRRAMESNGTLLVFEHVIGPYNASPEGKFMDLNMLVITGGIERSEAEYLALFERTGFDLVRTIPTASPISIVEGRPR